MKTSFSVPFLLALALSAAFCSIRLLLLFWTAAAVHEGGHLLALRCMKTKVQQLRFRLSGLEILFDGRRLSYQQEAILALSGPGANLFLCLLTLILNAKSPCVWWPLLCAFSLAEGLFNLLPALPLDGGRALRAMLLAWKPDKGDFWLTIIGRIFGVLLVFLGMKLGKYGIGVSLLAAGGVIFSALPGKRLYTLRKKRYTKYSSLPSRRKL